MLGFAGICYIIRYVKVLNDQQVIIICAAGKTNSLGTLYSKTELVVQNLWNFF